ncbi:hypothetical protein ZEAMMB73_Zm00001d050620 [Zea mays]|uniref:Uncharacterized protein n=1 Tax=Zea mays TaxID=4577 RepID=A0A1D6Q2Q8_MAIZE|nr:hypothetical protein ZEAMMB73_Zm00001d050620 [Zea mays]
MDRALCSTTVEIGREGEFVTSSIGRGMKEFGDGGRVSRNRRALVESRRGPLLHLPWSSEAVSRFRKVISILDRTGHARFRCGPVVEPPLVPLPVAHVVAPVGAAQPQSLTLDFTKPNLAVSAGATSVTSTSFFSSVTAGEGSLSKGRILVSSGKPPLSGHKRKPCAGAGTLPARQCSLYCHRGGRAPTPGGLARAESLGPRPALLWSGYRGCARTDAARRARAPGAAPSALHGRPAPVLLAPVEPAPSRSTSPEDPRPC